MAEKKYDDAEQYLKNALSLSQGKGADKDSPQIAMSLASLADLYAAEEKLDLARDQAMQSFAILQRNYEKTGSGNPGARQAYGRAAAQESWLLVQLAKKRHDAADLAKQCHDGGEFLGFLDSADRESVISACQSATASSETKP